MFFHCGTPPKCAGHTEAVLRGDRRARGIEIRGDVFPGLSVHRVPLHEEGVLPSGHKLHQPGVDPVERSIDKRLAAREDRLAPVVEIQYVAHGPPGFQRASEQIGRGFPGVRRPGPHHRQADPGEEPEVANP